MKVVYIKAWFYAHSFHYSLKTLSKEFRTSCPWELLYADDLVLTAETLDLLMEKLKLWKYNMENKGLRVSMGKIKKMIYGKSLDTIKPSGKYPCSVCRKAVGKNSIFCTSCDAWAHKKCNEIKGRLVSQMSRLSTPIDGRPVEHVSLGDKKLEVVESCVYFGDEIFPNGVCEVSTVARIRSVWEKFGEPLPLSTNHAIPLKSRGKV